MSDRLLARRPDAGQDDWLLFAMGDGSKVITLIDQFDDVLKEADITRNGHGEKYTLYSLRHFYAVMALRKGLGVFEVARNMGTSVEMIQKYYGKQATKAMFAHEIRGELKRDIYLKVRSAGPVYRNSSTNNPAPALICQDPQSRDAPCHSFANKFPFVGLR